MNDISDAAAKDDKFLTRPLLIIFLTIFIDLVGFGIVIPLLTFFAEEFQASPIDIGLLVASYSFMSGVAVIALMEVLCGAAMVGTMS